MSGTGTYAARGAVATPAAASPLIAAIVLALFVLSAVIGAERKDITQGFDEVAHASYVAQIQETGDYWPEFDSLRMLDPRTFQFTAKPSYLNHPPIYYDLLAALGPKLTGQPGAVVVDRLVSTAITALGFASLLWLGLAARLPRYQFYALAIPLACIPVLAPLAGAINNDDLAFTGGALATLGVWQLVATGSGGWLALALAGMIAAACAKLTALVLTGGMLGTVFLYLMWRGRWRWSWTALCAVAVAVAAAPFIVFLVQYHSPAPDTQALVAMLKDNARAVGLADQPRQSFAHYVGYFIVAFIVEWMPALAPRTALNYAMLAIPVVTIAGAVAGTALSLRRLWRREETALDVVVLAGALALAATLAIHIRFSYGHYLATGWPMEAYPRYYLPLAAIVPLACISLAAAIRVPQGRVALLMFLIVGPMLFRLLGAPLG